MSRHSCYNLSSEYVHAFCMRASVQICPGQNFYIYAGFQNNLVQLFSLKSRSANSKHFFQVDRRSRSYLKIYSLVGYIKMI